MNFDNILRNDEKSVYNMRALFEQYGYKQFRMSKFEEYDVYVRNKDFLVSDSIITFTGANGKLMALKPDVTFSIIKNTDDSADTVTKLYYNENVYRISDTSKTYKEIMQTGLECIGDIDLYDVYEVVSLACASLKSISDSYVLEISHLGVLSSLIDSISDDDSFKASVMECIKQKNAHEIKKLCEEAGVDTEKASLLCSFVGIYGGADQVLEKLYSMQVSDEFKSAVDELSEIMALLGKTEYSDKLRLDFSIVNDMNYYNGIVFNGFIEGVCETVLFGGRYDKLLAKMGRGGKGIGFAVYVDLLESLNKEVRGYDVDVLVAYDGAVTATELAKTVDSYVSKGLSVTTQKAIPEKLRYKELVDLRKGDAK